MAVNKYMLHTYIYAEICTKLTITLKNHRIFPPLHPSNYKKKIDKKHSFKKNLLAIKKPKRISSQF